MTATTADAVVQEQPGAAIIPTINETVVQPVAKTGQQLFGKVIGGVHWYLEQWEDLVMEAKEMVAPTDEGITAADILARLNEAQVISEIPGRIRWRLKELKGQTHLAEAVASALVSAPGVNQVSVRALTGSILVFYDAESYPSRESLLSAAVSQ